MRYYFHIVGGSHERDDVGDEFATLAKARENAIRYAGECMSHDLGLLTSNEEFRIEVTDERNLLLFMVIMLAVDVPASGEV